MPVLLSVEKHMEGIRRHIDELERTAVLLRRRVRDLEAWKATAKGLLEETDYCTDEDETDF
tara:strand:- start:911 stop:1093 length:183 start_codon:yes stop_codon:yes gene_type:complete